MGAQEAVILGLVQGLTEFLPVSSSGHLVIFQHLLGMNAPGVLLEVLTHVGTLLAVIGVFWRDIVDLLRCPWHKMLVLLFVGIIPTGLMGVVFAPLFEEAFESLEVVGIALWCTGLLLWKADRAGHGGKDLATTSVWDAFIIGLGQGLAITPGLSRSGTTIAFALLRGLDRDMAARYSFLLSIPAILGAAVWETKDLWGSQVLAAPVPWSYWLAALVAALSGYAAIKLFLGLLRRGHLYPFSFYCWAVGSLVLIAAVRGA